MKTRAAVAWEAGKPLEIEMLDLDGPKAGEVLLRNLRRGLSGRPRADDSFLEDCAQESLLRVLDKIDQFDSRSQFVTWATAIATRVALGQLRRSRWKDVSISDLVRATDQLVLVVPHRAPRARPRVAARRLRHWRAPGQLPHRRPRADGRDRR